MQGQSLKKHRGHPIRTAQTPSGDTHAPRPRSAPHFGSHTKRPRLNLRLWAMLALLGSLISLAVGTSFAKSLFPALGAEGTTAYRIVSVSYTHLTLPTNREV